MIFIHMINQNKHTTAISLFFPSSQHLKSAAELAIGDFHHVLLALQKKKYQYTNLFAFGVSIHFHTKIISFILPK